MREAASNAGSFALVCDPGKPGGKRDPATSMRFFATSICSFNGWDLGRCRCMRDSLYGGSAIVSHSPLPTVDGSVM